MHSSVVILGMETVDKNDNQKLVLRSMSLVGDVSKAADVTHLLLALWQVKKSRKMGSQQSEVLVRKRGRNVSRRVIGVRKRAARGSGYYYRYSKPRSAKGSQNHNHNQSLSIYRRLKKLQRLIPGGKDMEVDVLFQETAEYIMSLKMQVHLLQTLSNFWSSEIDVPHQPLGNSDQFS